MGDLGRFRSGLRVITAVAVVCAVGLPLAAPDRPDTLAWAAYALACGVVGIVGSVAYATRVDAAEDGFTCTRFPGRTVRFGPDAHVWPAFRWWRGMPEVVIDDGVRRMAVPWLVLQAGPGAVALKALKQGRNIENEDPYSVSEHEGAGIPAATIIVAFCLLLALLPDTPSPWHAWPIMLIPAALAPILLRPPRLQCGKDSLRRVWLGREKRIDRLSEADVRVRKAPFAGARLTVEQRGTRIGVPLSYPGGAHLHRCLSATGWAQAATPDRPDGAAPAEPVRLRVRPLFALLVASFMAFTMFFGYLVIFLVLLLLERFAGASPADPVAMKRQFVLADWLITLGPDAVGLIMAGFLYVLLSHTITCDANGVRVRRAGVFPGPRADRITRADLVRLELGWLRAPGEALALRIMVKDAVFTLAQPNINQPLVHALARLAPFSRATDATTALDLAMDYPPWQRPWPESKTPT